MNVTKAMLVCAECGRVFDLLDDDDANEWHYGHDCEQEGCLSQVRTVPLATWRGGFSMPGGGRGERRRVPRRSAPTARKAP